MSNKLKIKHQHHNTQTVYGSWGPHRAKIVCLDCGGAFVSWCKSHQPKSNGYKKMTKTLKSTNTGNTSALAKIMSIKRNMLNPDVINFSQYKGKGLITIEDSQGNKIYITQTSKKFRPKSQIDWAWYDSADLANALETNTTDKYYEQQLRDSRSDPNDWKDRSEEMTIKSYYAARSGRASLI